MTLVGFFLPCGPHLACEKHSGTLPWPTLRMHNSQNIAPQSAPLVCPLAFSGGDVCWHWSATLHNTVGRRSKSPNGPTEGFSLGLKWRYYQVPPHPFYIFLMEFRAVYPCLHHRFLNIHVLDIIFWNSWILYPDALINLQFKNPVIYTIPIQSILVKKLMIFHFLELVS